MERKSKFIHSVFFWLKENISEEERIQFEEGLQSLARIETIQQFYWGKAADTEKRAVVDHSYDYALIVHFDDQEGHDVYQPHDIHQAFVANNAKFWTTVKVYDSVMQ